LDLEKVNIAIIGGRSFKNKKLLQKTMQYYLDKYNILHIISGGAKGADTMGVQWANKHNIDTIVFKPDFKKHKRAYHYRNRQIVREADIVIAFWNTSSTGTKYTIDYARTLNKDVIIIKY
jgi:predicted Rossmann fold nucleotide-binding protein DprA/Smf involved in DNA uptake